MAWEGGLRDASALPLASVLHPSAEAAALMLGTLEIPVLLSRSIAFTAHTGSVHFEEF